MLSAVDSCFGLFGPHQHGTPNKQAQIPAARVFYISLLFSNARRVLSQCNTRLRLLYLLIKGFIKPASNVYLLDR